MESQSVDQQKLVHGDETIVKQADEIQLAALKIIGGKRQSKIVMYYASSVAPPAQPPHHLSSLFQIPT